MAQLFGSPPFDVEEDSSQDATIELPDRWAWDGSPVVFNCKGFTITLYAAGGKWAKKSGKSFAACQNLLKEGKVGETGGARKDTEAISDFDFRMGIPEE